MLIAFETLGCRLNEAETESWARQFQAAGDSIVPVSDADLVVLNTCAVTGEAARKSRQAIRRLRRLNPKAKLVISGCYASLNPTRVAAEMGVDLVVPNSAKDRLVSQVYNLNAESETTSKSAPDLFQRSRQRAFIKVQDGCRHRCTFCIVTIARGKEKSRPVEEVIDEIRQLQAQGVKEVVLTGVHLGGYGSDLGQSLTDLIQAALEQTEIPRIRMGSLEPWELSSDFFALFADSRLMPHLHLPLQSGSDAILKRMGRRCKTEDFRQLVSRARQYRPDLNLTTDIIVGFPGETEEDFAQTLALTEEIAFSHVHIFAYSPREGTAAASFSGQIDNALKKSRSKKLHNLATTLRRSILENHLGRVEAVLWEKRRQDNGQSWFYGYSPHYLRVKTAAQGKDLTNALTEVRLTAVGADGDYLIGEPV